MKIAIVGEHNRKGGGSYHQLFKTYQILKSIKGFEFNFLTIDSKNNNNENFINYKTNFIDQLFFLFYSSNILKSLLKKFKIQNKFEKFIKKKKINLTLFLGCSRLSIFCDKINYATYIYEFHHLFRPDLPEYKSWTDFNFRENLMKINVRKSHSLIVDTKKKAEDLIKYYNCYDKKINIIPLASNIVNLNELSIEKCSNDIKNFLSSYKYYFFYPAQYWSHKNHYYILLAIQLLNKKNNKKVNFVFTGQKKNNFEYIKKKVMEFNLGDQVKFFEYLKDDEIKILYKNCKALVMPTLVGYSSLPLYESFYFEKPVFYSKDLLDESLKKFVNEIDLDNPESLAEQINDFNNNADKINQKVDLAKKFYLENLLDKHIQSKYLNLLNKIKSQTEIYK